MGDEGDEEEITNAQYFSTRGCANDFSTRRYANAQYKCPMPNAQCPMPHSHRACAKIKPNLRVKAKWGLFVPIRLRHNYATNSSR